MPAQRNAADRGPDAQCCAVIFAEEAHGSRSDRYTYIPTATILGKLRAEGFQPFMVAQTRVRDESKREHTKHMLRLRHATQIADADAEANESNLVEQP